MINTITVNGRAHELDDTETARLRWIDIGILGGMDPKRVSNKMTVSYTVPGDDKPKPHVYGHSLIIVDGMTISATP